jgi:hypothetical protein
VFASDLAEDRNVASYNRQAVLRSFDQWQAKAFTFRGREKCIAAAVDFFQHFVGDALQPE